MDLDLGGKLALITGGSRGIGRAVGEALAAEGCRLVLVSRRAADLDIARTQIEGRYNVSVRTDAADLGDSTNVARLAQLFPDVDILVNNAGAIPGGTLFDVDEARWRTASDARRNRATCFPAKNHEPRHAHRGQWTAPVGILSNRVRSSDCGASIAAPSSGGAHGGVAASPSG
jgi:NAD(P)-dependent dehydrogenase (short-subunit alcohol dehydrogenase family)